MAGIVSSEKDKELRLKLYNKALEIQDRCRDACTEWCQNVGPRAQIAFLKDLLAQAELGNSTTRVVSCFTMVGMIESIAGHEEESGQGGNKAKDINAAKLKGDIVLHLEKTDEPGTPWGVDITVHKTTPYAALVAATECLMSICIEQGDRDSTQILKNLCIGAVHNAHMKQHGSANIPWVNPEKGDHRDN